MRQAIALKAKHTSRAGGRTCHPSAGQHPTEASLLAGSPPLPAHNCSASAAVRRHAARHAGLCGQPQVGAAARSGKSREAALLLGDGCCVPGDTPGSMLTYPPTSCLPPWLPQDLVEKFFNNDNAASFRKSWHRLSALPDAYNYKVGGEGVLLARGPCLSHPVPALRHRIRSSERGVSSCSCCPHRPAGLLGRARGRLDGHVPTSGAALRCVGSTFVAARG